MPKRKTQSSDIMSNWLKLKPKEEKQKKISNKPISKTKPKTKAKIKIKPKKEKQKQTEKIEKLEKLEKSVFTVPKDILQRWYPGMVRKPPPNAGNVEIPKVSPGCLKGLKFVITGVLDSLERDEAIDLIIKGGGRVTTAVSGVTSFLVRGEEAGLSKISKAQEKDVPIIDETALLELIRKKSKSVKSIDSERKEFNKTAKEAEKENFIKPNVKKLKIETEKMGEDENRKLLKKDDQNLVWSEKYRPKSLDEVVGNKMCIEKLKSFINSFLNRKRNAPKPKGKNTKNAILLSGPPGIGKTSSVYALAHDFNLEIIEMNASDVRSKKILNNQIKEALTSRSVLNYYSKKKNDLVLKNKTPKRRGKIILMEEVDGMSVKDQGGTSELIKFIEQTKFAIVCTCNDRMALKLRSLANHCLDVRFVRPTAMQILQRLGQIFRSEKIKMDRERIIKLIQRSNCDLRSAINNAEFIVKKDYLIDSNSKVEKKVHENDHSDNHDTRKYKDESLNSWEAATNLFTPSKGVRFEKNYFDERIQNYFVDQMFVPLLVQENYLYYKPKNSGDFDVYAETASMLADSDLVNEAVYSKQSFSLMPFHAILSCVLPASAVSNGYKPFRLLFPGWLGRNSARNKKYKLALEAQGKHSATSQSTNLSKFATESSEILLKKIYSPLIQDGKEGIEETLENLSHSGLDKEDLDLLAELNSYETNKIAIDPKVKSAFTRNYNSVNKKHLETMKKISAVRTPGKKLQSNKNKRKTSLNTKNKSARKSVKRKTKLKRESSEEEDEYHKDSFLVSDSEEEPIKKPKRRSKKLSTVRKQKAEKGKRTKK